MNDKMTLIQYAIEKYEKEEELVDMENFNTIIR